MALAARALGRLMHKRMGQAFGRWTEHLSKVSRQRVSRRSPLPLPCAATCKHGG